MTFYMAPATDTRELPAVRRGVPLVDLPTAELHVLDLRPPVVPVRRRPRSLTRAWARVRRLVTRDDLAGAWSSATTWVGGIALGLAILTALTLTRHAGDVLLTSFLGGH